VTRTCPLTSGYVFHVIRVHAKICEPRTEYLMHYFIIIVIIIYSRASRSFPYDPLRYDIFKYYDNSVPGALVDFQSLLLSSLSCARLQYADVFSY
jgi:hypothetical protein